VHQVVHAELRELDLRVALVIVLQNNFHVLSNTDA